MNFQLELDDLKRRIEDKQREIGEAQDALIDAEEAKTKEKAAAKLARLIDQLSKLEARLARVYDIIEKAQTTQPATRTVQGAKSVVGVRSRLYLIAGSNQGYYPENNLAFSYQEDSNVLDICVIFETKDKALDFETELRNQAVTNNAVEGLKVSLNVSSIDPIPLNQRIFYTDYNPTDYDSPQGSISHLSNQYSIYDPKSDQFIYQSIESPKEFGNHCKAEGCHIMSSSHCKKHDSYKKYDDDDNNRLLLSPLVHGWYDGRNCDVPLFNLILTDVSKVRQDGRYRVELDILALDSESAELLFKRLKEGTGTVQSDPLRRKTHVMVKNTNIFRICIEWKRKEIDEAWMKYRENRS